MKKERMGDEPRKFERSERSSERMQPKPLGETDLGMPSWDNPEPNTEKLAPLHNRFSSLHDVSEDEAYKIVRGSTTSANIKKGGY